MRRVVGEIICVKSVVVVYNLNGCREEKLVFLLSMGSTSSSLKIVITFLRGLNPSSSTSAKLSLLNLDILS